VVRRCYESLTSVDKERLLDAMNSSPTFTGPSSQSSREIKSLITTVHLDLYRSGVSEWRALIVKQKKAEIMLAELERGTEVKPVSGTSAAGKSSSAKSKVAVDEIDEIFPPEEQKVSKKDRKIAVASSVPPSSAAEPSKAHKNLKQSTSSTAPHDTSVEERPDEEQKRKRKRKRPSSSTPAFAHPPHAASVSSGSVSATPKAEEQKRVDMNKIRTLQSGKMISIKRITEELVSDLSHKKKRS
jgi:hypothetical protein